MAVYLPILTALLAGVGLRRPARPRWPSRWSPISRRAASWRCATAGSSGGSSPRDNPEVLLLMVLGLAAAGRRGRPAAAGLRGGRRVPGRHRAVRRGRRERPRRCSPRCATCSPRCSSSSSACTPTPPTSRRCCCRALALAVVTALTKIGHRLVGRPAGRHRDRRAAAGRRRAGRPRRVLHRHRRARRRRRASNAPGLGPLAAAYVLILAVTGPLTARAGEPVGR